MIPLALPAMADAERPYVTRLRVRGGDEGGAASDSFLVGDAASPTFCGRDGLLVVDGASAGEVDGDVVLVHPLEGRVDRLFRAGSTHNTLLVTERCDQLCVMCSQPPKKTHIDRFDHFEAACLLAAPGTLIGVSGGEPTLYKDRLLTMIERVLGARDDLAFHVLTNAQHFEEEDIARLRDPLFTRVVWGVPLYAPEPPLHDRLVGKEGAFERLEHSLERLLLAGARIELRTVVMTENAIQLGTLARRIASRLRFIEVWSLMQLENIGYARRRWPDLYFDHAADFKPVATALDIAALHGVAARLFNFPLCSVPEPYRAQAPASISDWKRKYSLACEMCSARDACCGFFEWHPQEQMEVRPL